MNDHLSSIRLGTAEGRSDGVEFACKEEGSGKPVIFVHGSLGSWADFSRQVHTFGKDYRALSYSRRFHPPNPCIAGAPYTLRRHAEDLAAVIDALAVERPAVVACSWGGCAVLLCAILHPGLLGSLVLCEPPMLPLLERTPEGMKLAADFRDAVLIPATAAFDRGDAAGGIRRFFDGVAGKNGSLDALSLSAKERLLEAGPELQLEFQTDPHLYMPALPDELLAGVDIPVLLLEGERSPRMFGVITDELAHILPNTRRETISRAGHSMQMNNPEAFDGAVASFLHEIE